ncbi:MAG: hypothetical protein ACSHW0_02120 [Thalassotalea sp.]
MKKIFLITVVIAATYLLIFQSGVTEKLSHLLPSYQFERLDKNMTEQLQTGMKAQLLALKAQLREWQQQDNLKGDLKHNLKYESEMSELSAQIQHLNAQVQQLTEQLENTVQHSAKIKASELTESVNAETAAAGSIKTEVAPIDTEVELTASSFAATQYITPAQTISMQKTAEQKIAEQTIAQQANQSFKLQRIIERMEQQSLALLASE